MQKQEKKGAKTGDPDFKKKQAKETPPKKKATVSKKEHEANLRESYKKKDHGHFC